MFIASVKFRMTYHNIRKKKIGKSDRHANLIFRTILSHPYQSINLYIYIYIYIYI